MDCFILASTSTSYVVLILFFCFYYLQGAVSRTGKHYVANVINVYPCCQIKEVVFISSHNIISWKSRDLEVIIPRVAGTQHCTKDILLFIIVFVYHRWCVVLLLFISACISPPSSTHTTLTYKHIIIVIYTMDEVRYWRHAPAPMYFCHGGHSAAQPGTRHTAALFTRYV